jgi:hypothetical protein
MKLDLDFIKAVLRISDEELMERLVKDAVGLQKEAEEERRKADIGIRLTDPEYREFVLKFFNEMDYLRKFFTDEEIIETCAKYMSKRDLAVEQPRRGRVLKENIQYGKFSRYGRAKFTEYQSRGNWQREVEDDATYVFVANQYQAVSGGEQVVKELLLNRLPWLSEYKIQVYQVTDRNDWIFIRIPEADVEGADSTTSLYCPYSALLNHDPEKIVETHRNYWYNYCRGRYNDEADAYLESEPVKAFLTKVAG